MCFEENCCLLGMGLIILFQFQRSVIMQVWFHTDSKGKKKNNFLWRDGYKYICVLCVGWNSVVFSDKLLGSQSLISRTIKPELAVVKHCCLQQSVWSNTPSRDQTIMLGFFFNYPRPLKNVSIFSSQEICTWQV